MYKILKIIFPQSEIFAVSGALIFCLFPPDTTKLLLLHAFSLQTSLGFLLVATLLYLNNRKILCYIPMVMALLTYESVFLVFLGVPLLNGKWDKQTRKDLLKNFLIICFLAICALIYRRMTGESRVVEATEGNLFDLLYKIISSMIIGPLMNLFLFLRAPVVTVMYWIQDKSIWWYYDYIFYFIAFCFILYLWYFYNIKSDYELIKSADKIKSDPLTESANEDKNVNQYFKKLISILIAGIVLIILAYAASFTHYPPVIIMGRSTSVHLAATFGGSIIFAAICTSLFFLSEKYNRKKAADISLSVYLTLLIGYNTYCQKEFVQCWIFQKAYWKKIVELCPDLKESTVVLVNAGYSNFFATRYISPLTPASDHSILTSLYKFPLTWLNKPRTFTVWDGWQSEAELVNGQLLLKRPSFPPLVLNDSNVIYLRANQDNVLERVDSISLNLSAKTLYLKPLEDVKSPSFPTTKLYDIMIRQD